MGLPGDGDGKVRRRDPGEHRYPRAAKKRGLRKGNEKERPGSKEADKERGVSRAEGGDSVEQGAARVASDSSR